MRSADLAGAAIVGMATSSLTLKRELAPTSLKGRGMGGY